MEYLQFVYVPVLVVFFGYVIRIERTLVKIQVDIKYLKALIPGCLPPSDENTP